MMTEDRDDNVFAFLLRHTLMVRALAMRWFLRLMVVGSLLTSISQVADAELQAPQDEKQRGAFRVSFCAAEAKSKADAIRDQYQKQLDQTKQLIQDKQYNQATAVLRRIKSQYQTLAESDFELLNKQIREQRRN